MPETTETGIDTGVDFENKELQKQAFEINANLFKESHPIVSLEGLEGREKAISEQNNRSNEYRLKNIEHTEKYFRGLPHDPNSAVNGMVTVMDVATQRMDDIRKDPDDAVAAETDYKLLSKAYDAMFDKMRKS